MKAKKNVSYFPVSAVEQALLLRVREPDLEGRADDLLPMLDQIAEARLTPADLDQAIQLLSESRQGEGLDARFDNLEARLKERIERGLSEIEGRLSKRFGGESSTMEPAPPESSRTSVTELIATPQAPVLGNPGIPAEASVAFRIGSDLVWGASAAQFYIAVWRWLFEHGRVQPGDLPIQGGKKRYVVAASPVHPSGKDFTSAGEPVPGVFVEANLSRGDIIRRAKKYLGQFGVAFEVVVGSD
jgi:hypothetical protein